MEPDRFATHFCDIEKIPHKTKFKQSYIMYKPYGLEVRQPPCEGCCDSCLNTVARDKIKINSAKDCVVLG